MEQWDVVLTDSETNKIHGGNITDILPFGFVFQKG